LIVKARSAHTYFFKVLGVLRRQHEQPPGIRIRLFKWKMQIIFMPIPLSISVLNLLPTQIPGAPGTVGTRGKLRTFSIPHIPRDDV
jgi:hypothetical protein